jgi:SPP1 gp7 family putative phage head morphogenesis protein
VVLPVNPDESIVVRRMREHKAELIARNGDTLLAMGNRWLQLEQAIDANITALALEMAEAQRTGGTITYTMLWRQRRYQTLIAQLHDEVAAYNKWATEYIKGGQLSLGKLGISHAAETVQLSLMEGGQGVGIFFDRLPVSAVETMVGIAGEGGPIYTLLQQAYPEAVNKLTNILIENTLLGKGPRQTAREMIDGTAASLNHSLTVARTEQLRVYREAARQQYESSGLVESYRRLSAKNDRTCAVCLALDGEVYPTNELMHVHPNDRCTMVPNVTGMPRVEWETGEEWLKKQDLEVQQQIMGQGAQELWSSGKIDLKDLATKTEHEIWGPSLQQTPLSGLQ